MASCVRREGSPYTRATDEVQASTDARTREQRRPWEMTAECQRAAQGALARKLHGEVQASNVFAEAEQRRMHNPGRV